MSGAESPRPRHQLTAPDEREHDPAGNVDPSPQLSPGRSASTVTLLHRIRLGLIALGCLAAVFGARIDYIDRFASDVPNWDQWYSDRKSVV